MKPAGRRNRVVAEINITPFTDVVLVLLIIFMITTPLLMQSERSQGQNENAGFDVQLPQAKGGGISGGASQVVVAILQDGRMVLKGEVVSEEDLKTALLKVKAENPQALVIIQADRMVNHWRVVRAMDISAEVGLRRMAIATQED